MITYKVFYEWDIEEFEFDSEYEDIIDHDFSDKCPGIPNQPGFRLALIRDEWQCIDGEPYDLRGRQWAYVEDGKLPEEFDGGAKVPKRFHKELERSK